jgi:5-methylcytosine-specific restriction endonuclease McrA
LGGVILSFNINPEHTPHSTTHSSDAPLKRCSNPACEQRWKPATPEFFHRTRRNKDGLAPYCKACAYAKHKARRLSPEERAKENAKSRARYAKPEIGEKRRTYLHNYRAAKRGRRETVSVAQIQEQLKRQKCRCYYCSTKFERRYIYHVDHTFPLSKASGNDPINGISYLVLACPDCNVKKKDRYPHEFPEGGKLL